MTTLQRFTIALHALALAQIARHLGVEAAPDFPAWGSTTSPQDCHVRGIVEALDQAGLSTLLPGPGRGWQLARDPGRLTLLEVYRAVAGEQDAGPGLIETGAPGSGASGRSPLPEPPTAALTSRLARITIADFVATACAQVPSMEPMWRRT